MSEANRRQVGGDHYKNQKIQHWDFVAANNLDYFQGQITKYVSRWREKNGIQDLEKALHFLEKYIEVEKARATPSPEARLTEQEAERVQHVLTCTICARPRICHEEFFGDYRTICPNCWQDYYENPNNPPGDRSGS